MTPTREPERLDAPGNFRIVFKMRKESFPSTKLVEQVEGYKSLREASIAVQRLIESRAYSPTDLLGARIIDLDNFPNKVAFVSFNGEVYEDESNII